MGGMIYFCDPEKNTECRKMSCFLNGGPCRETTHKEYSLRCARVLPKEEVLLRSGAGYMESWFEADEEEGIEEEKILIECAYCRGYIIDENGNYTTSDYTTSEYGKKYGIRVWDNLPTHDEQEAAEWE